MEPLGLGEPSLGMDEAAEVAHVSVDALAAALLGRKKPLILDVRGVDFLLGFIPGSRRVPFELCERDVGRIAAEVVAGGASAVVVCNTGGKLSQQYAAELSRQVRQRSGSVRCRVGFLVGGLRAWEQRFAGDGRYIARFSCFPGAPHACLAPIRRAAAVQQQQQQLATAGVGQKLGDVERWPLCGGWASEASADTPRTSTPRSTHGDGASESSPRPGSNAEEPGNVAEGGWRSRVASGDVLQVRTPGGSWLPCLVTACTEGGLRVQYFASGKRFEKELPKHSADLRLRRAGAGGRESLAHNCG